MRILLLTAICLLSLPEARAAGNCHGQTTSCWSACDNAFVPVAGDSCDTYWNSSRNCFDARGNCGGGSAPEPHDCRGQSTQCWSACDNRYITQHNSDSCTTAWNSKRKCFEGIGYCSKR